MFVKGLSLTQKVAYFSPKIIWDAKVEVLCVIRTQKIDRRCIPWPYVRSALGSFGTSKQRNQMSLGRLLKVSSVIYIIFT